MDYFNINTFLLGSLLFACLYLSNIIYSLLCIFCKVRIVEFSIFFNPWFSLHQETIMGTKFSLGWLPLGGYIKPLGLSADDEEREKINTADLPYAFFNKPKYLQTVFRLVPWVIYLGAAIISILIITPFSFPTELLKIGNYITEALNTMFSGGIQDRVYFIESTRQITDGKNLVFFAFALLVIFMLLLTPFTLIMNWFSNDGKKNKLQQALGFAVTIAILWFIIWKIPKFIFSFFTFFQSLIYLGSFLIGLFSVGLVFFYSTLFVFRNVAQNINDNKVK